MENPTRNQDATGKFIAGNKANPTGKGGFQERPQDRSNGRWSKDNSFSYWMNYFKQLSVEEFKNYAKTKPENERTVAEDLAYARVAKSRTDLKEFKEVADRTEGMSVRRTEISGVDGNPLNIAVVEIVGSQYDEHSNKVS